MTAPVRVGDPGELCAMVPHLVGFTPTESLVLLCLHDPRGRVGLTARVDLDAPADVVLDQLSQAVVSDGARSVLLVVFTGDAGERPHAALVERLVRGLPVPVDQALLVRDGRWSSYTCDAACCPPDSPVATASPAVGRVSAERVWEGRPVLQDREALVASVEPALPLGAAVAAAAQAVAAEDLARRLAEDAEAGRHDELERWRAALTTWQARPGTVDPRQVPALAVGLHLVPVRDQVTSWVLDDGPGVLGLALAVARLTAPPDDAPVSAVLAWVAYAEGQGALALVAAQRALRTDPGLSMATLLLQALDAVAPPAVLRNALRASRPRPAPRRRRRGAA